MKQRAPKQIPSDHGETPAAQVGINQRPSRPANSKSMIIALAMAVIIAGAYVCYGSTWRAAGSPTWSSFEAVRQRRGICRPQPQILRRMIAAAAGNISSPVFDINNTFFGKGTVLSSPKVALVRDHPTKGRAVVAQEDLAPGIFVGIYPGQMYRTPDYSTALTTGETRATYGLSYMPVTTTWHYVHNDTGLQPSEWTIDPGEEVFSDLRYDRFVTMYLNEPSEGESFPNTHWVENLDEFRMELWTYKPVPAGHELLICYGPNYQSTREAHNYSSPICMGDWGVTRFEMASSDNSMHIDTPYCSD